MEILESKKPWTKQKMRNTEYKNLYEFCKDFPVNVTTYARKDLDYRGNEIVEYKPDLTIKRISKQIEDPESDSKLSEFFVIFSPFFCSGDYCGETIHHANRNCIVDQFKDLIEQELIQVIYQDYSTKDLVFNLSIEDQDLMEILSGLMDYPLISDDELSEIESEIESEYMDTLVQDLKHNIDQKTWKTGNFLTLPEDPDHESKLYDFIRENMEYYNLNVIFEMGELAYLPDQDKFMSIDSLDLVDLFCRDILDINTKTVPASIIPVLYTILNGSPFFNSLNR